MTYIVLLLALWDGSEVAVIQSKTTFRKQEVCQLVGEGVKRKSPKVVAFRCIQRTNV